MIGGSITAITNWLHYGDHQVAPLRRSQVASLRRSWNGTIAPIINKSQRDAVLTVPSVHRLVKGWCRAINLKSNYGSHTLRKTWGYHQRVTFGTDLPRLMVCFNHSTQRQSLDYLCIQPQEIKDVYENVL